MKRRSTTILLTVLACALFTTPALAQEDDSDDELPSVEEVTDKLDDLYRSEASHGTIEMKITTDRGTRTLELEQWSKGEEKALFVIRSPSREAGTATLRNDDGLWNYAPRADRLMRIPSGLLSDNWMGSHLTNDDLVRETSFEEDFNSEIEWTEHNGERHLKISMDPKPDAPVVWEKVEYLMSAEEWLPVRASFYDDGEEVRRMSFSDVEELDDRKIPTVMQVEPTAGPDKGEKTRMEYKEMEFDADVDDGIFTKRGLRRVAKSR